MPRTTPIVALLALATLLSAAAPARAQEPAASRAQEGKGKGKRAKQQGAVRPGMDPSDTATLNRRERRANEVAARFWDQTAPLELVLTMDVRRLRGDRNENAPWRPATLTYTDPAGRTDTLPLQVRTRGIFRLKHCRFFPPLRLNFAEKAARGTIFEGVNKPKMVSVCANDDRSERSVLQEFQLYRVNNLLTPASHKVRLARITYANVDGKPEMTRWAFLIEEPEAVAARLRGALIEERGARSQDLEPRANALMGVFQYFVGNTDFSVGSLHNVEIVRVGYGVHVPVAYDFDFAGAVNASYAKPPPQVRTRHVRERVFRGECAPEEDFLGAVALLRDRKPEIYALYADSLGKLLPPDAVRETLSYFDGFYAETADDGAVRRRIVRVCRQG